MHSLPTVKQPFGATHSPRNPIVQCLNDPHQPRRCAVNITSDQTECRSRRRKARSKRQKQTQSQEIANQQKQGLCLVSLF